MTATAYVEELRLRELDTALSWLSDRTRILDVGAGTGWQARRLADLGHDVEAVDLPHGEYTPHRIWPVRDYDGRTLPYPDRSFDLVFSSNVLEHVDDLAALLPEIRRVLRPGGFAVHVVPSASWRWWTNVTYYPDRIRRAVQLLRVRFLDREAPSMPRYSNTNHSAPRSWLRHLVPPPHGAIGSASDELARFRRAAWLRLLSGDGYDSVRYIRGGIFYTGSIIAGGTLSFAARRRLSRILGSSTHIFVCHRSDRPELTS